MLFRAGQVTILLATLRKLQPQIFNLAAQKHLLLLTIGPALNDLI
jgi:hypothetical protein